MNLLRTLYHFQQEGYLCDITLVASNGREFTAHAGVLAAASLLLKQELEECERGNYRVVTSLSGQEVHSLIHYAYTGETSDPLLSSFTEMGLLCDKYGNQYHVQMMLSLLTEFAERGLFCNVACYDIKGQVQPAHSYIVAAKYTLLSKDILSESLVSFQFTKRLQTLYFNLKSVGRGSEHPEDHNHNILNISDIYANNAAFNSKFSEKRNRYLSTGNVDKYFACELCDKSFTQKFLYNRHQLSHSSTRAFSCQICHKGFYQRSDLNRHELTHVERDARPHACDECHKRFARKDKLKIHQRVHTGECPFVCLTCCKSFSQKRDLIRHELTHTGDRPHVCVTCEKAFAQKGDLKRHELTHTKVKPHVCVTCSKAFARREKLNRHMLLHTGIWPFICHACDKGFLEEDQFNTHNLIHSLNKPFTCDICDKGFTRKADVKRHQKKIHKCG